MTDQNLLSLIGNTPLVRLRRLESKPGVKMYAKLEGQNPSGSIKDRVVIGLVKSAEERGDIRPGHTIVEASSGNTSIALAMACRQRDYQVHVVIPEDAAPNIGDILHAYGAEVTWCESNAGMNRAIELAKEIAEERDGYYLGQFSDEVNVRTHYQTTGEEIVEALPRVDAFVAGIGTGGTIMGVGRRLREANPDVQIVGVEPRMGEKLHGLRSLSESFAPPLLDLDLLNSRFLVDSATAIKATRRIIREEGILAGISAGATLSVAVRWAERMESGTIVIMFSDGAWKYLPARPWDAADRGDEELDEIYWW
jgi:cysteine synthase